MASSKSTTTAAQTEASGSVPRLMNDLRQLTSRDTRVPLHPLHNAQVAKDEVKTTRAESHFVREMKRLDMSEVNTLLLEETETIPIYATLLKSGHYYGPFKCAEELRRSTESVTYKMIGPGISEFTVGTQMGNLRKEYHNLKAAEHRLVVRTLGFYKIGTLYALRSEHFSNSLEDSIVMKTLTDEKRLNYLCQIIELHEHLEKSNVYHPDINPKSLMLAGNGQLKLKGLESALQLTEKWTEILGQQGNPQFWAIQIALNIGYTFAANVTALGHTIVQLFEGRKLITEECEEEIKMKIVDLESLKNQIDKMNFSSSWKKTLKGTLAHKEDERPKLNDMKELLKMTCRSKDDKVCGIVKAVLELDQKEKTSKGGKTMEQVIFGTRKLKWSSINAALVKSWIWKFSHSDVGSLKLKLTGNFLNFEINYGEEYGVTVCVANGYGILCKLNFRKIDLDVDTFKTTLSPIMRTMVIEIVSILTVTPKQKTIDHMNKVWPL